MKKVLSILFLLLLSLSLFACNEEANSEDPDNVEVNKVSLITPGGTPLLAVGGLLDNEAVEIESVSGPENLQAALASGSHDIVIAPVNLGANLFNNGKSQYKIAAVITMNNAYIVTRADNALESVNDLEGKSIMAFGKAGIPGSLLKKLYSSNEKLSLDLIGENWYGSSAEVYGLFKGETGPEYALMSEPEISKLVLNDKIDVKTLDLCELLNIEVAPQACIYVNPNSKYQEEIKNVLTLIEENIKSLNENPEAYADKVLNAHKYFTSMGKEVIVRSIPLTSISYKVASSVKSDIENILTVLNASAKLPSDEFYYQK